MGLALVTNLLNQSPEERYEEILNELLDFCDEYYGAFDQKALRILLAACWMHKFTDHKVPWLWVNRPPQKFDVALGQALGAKMMFNPKLLPVCDRALWVLLGEEGLFHREPADVRNMLRQMEETHRDNPVNLMAFTVRPLDRLQEERARAAWPIVQNVFVNLRFEDMGNDWNKRAELRKKWQDKDEWVTTMLRRHIVNLMDADHRDRRHRAKVPPGFFDSLATVTGLVEAFRGPAFDVALLLHRCESLAAAHSHMMGKYSSDSEDQSLARKLLLDAIPPSSLAVLRALPLDGYWSLSQVQTACKLSLQRCRGVVTALEAHRSVVKEDALKLDRDGRRRHPRRADYYTVGPELQAVLLAGF